MFTEYHIAENSDTKHVWCVFSEISLSTLSVPNSAVIYILYERIG